MMTVGRHMGSTDQRNIADDSNIVVVIIIKRRKMKMHLCTEYDLFIEYFSV